MIISFTFAPEWKATDLLPMWILLAKREYYLDDSEKQSAEFCGNYKKFVIKDWRLPLGKRQLSPHKLTSFFKPASGNWAVYSSIVQRLLLFYLEKDVCLWRWFVVRFQWLLSPNRNATKNEYGKRLKSIAWLEAQL